MTQLPKAINCRLGTQDMDIKEDLHKHETDKTERVKKLIRLGLQYEAMLAEPSLVPDEQTALVYRVFISDLRSRQATS